MQAGIPNPRANPKKNETKQESISDELFKAKSIGEAMIPTVIHRSRNFERSNCLANEAPTNAERIRAEKWATHTRLLGLLFSKDDRMVEYQTNALQTRIMLTAFFLLPRSESPLKHLLSIRYPALDVIPCSSLEK